MARKQTYTRQFGNELADHLLIWVQNLTTLTEQKEIKKFLFIERFLINHQVPPRRLQDIVERSPKFAETYDTFKAMRAVILQEGGLFNEYNTKITTLLLSHYHDIKEKHEVQHSGQLDMLESMLEE